MADSFGGQGPPDPDAAGPVDQEPVPPPAHPPTAIASPSAGAALAHPPQDAPEQPYQPAQASQPSPAWDRTGTVTGAGADVSPTPQSPRADPAAWSGGNAGNAGYPQQLIRYGPGVPAPGYTNQAVPTAAEVWRTGLPREARRPRPLRRLAGPALSAVLLVASGVVIFLRLYHPPFGVTGVAITTEVKSGCTEDVTGRVSTTGGAGTVSYQWVFTPQLATPRPLSQSVAAGQSAVYVTAAVAGQGHGRLAQTVTLQVLGPEPGSASAHVILSC
jgi:hypothetical protein